MKPPRLTHPLVALAKYAMRPFYVIVSKFFIHSVYQLTAALLIKFIHRISEDFNRSRGFSVKALYFIA